jgi:hypothetical protein
MFHVWLVITSWDYEGGAVKGVFTSKHEAEKHVFYLKSESGMNFDWIDIQMVATDHPVHIGVPTADEV